MTEIQVADRHFFGLKKHFSGYRKNPYTVHREKFFAGIPARYCAVSAAAQQGIERSQVMFLEQEHIERLSQGAQVLGGGGGGREA